MSFLKALLPLAAFLFSACTTPVEYEDHWLDGPSVNDPSLSDPSYRVSTRPGLTPADRNRPVVIATHGYSASTFEWTEFRDYAESKSNVLVSLVLLGGHGRTVDGDFDGSTWQEWGRPILDEYQALVDQGYMNISILGSSTSGALMLSHLADGRFRERPPKHFLFVDPIVVPGDKMLTLIPVLAPLLGNLPNDNVSEEEKAYWYTNRPARTLAQLNDLCKHVRSELEKGISLPPASRAKVYKTSRDQTADPVSALLIYKGLHSGDGGKVAVQMIESDLHVFTRLAGRPSGSFTASDVKRQQAAFSDIVTRLTQP